MQDKIYIKGARENNLKNVDVEIARTEKQMKEAAKMMEFEYAAVL